MLELDGLSKKYWTAKGEMTALESVSLKLSPGGSLAVIGESGAGKSTLARCILGLEPPSRGRVWFEGMEVTAMGAEELRCFWRRAQMIWQEPSLALSPNQRVGPSVAEPLQNYTSLGKNEIKKRVDHLLGLVGLDPALGHSYSHQLSGGQCQRICIARAIALEPSLLICDEPVSALDLPMQLKIMELLQGLRQRLGLALIIITHDLGLAKRFTSDAVIMRKGEIVESGPSREILAMGSHPYTKSLLRATPTLPWPEGKLS